MIFSVVAPNLTLLQIGVIVRQMFQRSKDSSPMKIAVTLLVILVVVGSAKFGGAQQPSPIPNASPIGTPTSATPTPPQRSPRLHCPLRARRLACAFCTDARPGRVVQPDFLTATHLRLGWCFL